MPASAPELGCQTREIERLSHLTPEATLDLVAEPNPSLQVQILCVCHGRVSVITAYVCAASWPAGCSHCARGRDGPFPALRGISERAASAGPRVHTRGDRRNPLADRMEL